MLRFSNPPDTVFQAILRHCLIIGKEHIEDLIDTHRNDTEALKDMCASYPNMSRVFSPQLAVTTLDNLLSVLDRPEVYELNDYHYVLIYDVLNSGIQVHNDYICDPALTKKDQNEASFVDPYFIQLINFNEILDEYFVDLDFLEDAETMTSLTQHQKAVLDFRPETFGVTQGMKPHLSETALNISTDTDLNSYKIKPSDCFGTTSRNYPCN